MQTQLISSPSFHVIGTPHKSWVYQDSAGNTCESPSYPGLRDVRGLDPMNVRRATFWPTEPAGSCGP